VAGSKAPNDKLPEEPIQIRVSPEQLRQARLDVRKQDRLLVFAIGQILASRRVEAKQLLHRSDGAMARRVQFAIDKLHIALAERAARIVQNDVDETAS
jgi:hypothetical protein